jgi:hypothetical protein
MSRHILSAILLCVSLTLTAGTVMVETVDYGFLGDLEQEKQDAIIQSETGVMEALFDGGHLFFNMYTSNGELDSEKSRNSMDQAKRAGAEWFIRLQMGDEELFYWFYQLRDFDLKSEGSIKRDEIDPDRDMSPEEFFFAAGNSAGKGILTYMDR